MPQKLNNPREQKCQLYLGMLKAIINLTDLIPDSALTTALNVIELLLPSTIVVIAIVIINHRYCCLNPKP